MEKKFENCAEAIAYLSKDGVKPIKEYTEAQVYLKKNARDDDGEAQYWIAFTNEGNSSGFVAAQKAVKAGNVKAYYILGNCYRYGRGCLKDKEKAKQCYIKGMNLGVSICTEALKSMERNGKLLAGGAIFGKALLKIGEAIVNSGALDPEGFDKIDNNANYDDDYDDYE